MILYTPMQLELVLEGMEPPQKEEYKKVNYQGIPVLINSAGKVERILSTNPKDFLRRDIFPGASIDPCLCK